jgi:hypothetical protein
MSTQENLTTSTGTQSPLDGYGSAQTSPLANDTGTRPHHDRNTLLALALLLDFLPHDQAHQLHQRFATEVLYKLPQGRSPLFLSRHDVMSWVNAV